MLSNNPGWQHDIKEQEIVRWTLSSKDGGAKPSCGGNGSNHTRSVRGILRGEYLYDLTEELANDGLHPEGVFSRLNM